MVAKSKEEVLEYRDVLLDGSGHMLLSDQMDYDQKEVVEYRKALRAVEEQPEFPEVVDWPEEPQPKS